MISEAVVGIRTVSTLALEQRLVQLYKEGLADNQARDFKATVVSALARGYSEFAMMAIDGLLFYVGGLLVDADKLSFRVSFGPPLTLVYPQTLLFNAPTVAPP